MRQGKDLGMYESVLDLSKLGLEDGDKGTFDLDEEESPRDEDATPVPREEEDVTPTPQDAPQEPQPRTLEEALADGGEDVIEVVVFTRAELEEASRRERNKGKKKIAQGTDLEVIEEGDEEPAEEFHIENPQHAHGTDNATSIDVVDSLHGVVVHEGSM